MTLARRRIPSVRASIPESGHVEEIPSPSQKQLFRDSQNRVQVATSSATFVQLGPLTVHASRLLAE